MATRKTSKTKVNDAEEAAPVGAASTIDEETKEPVEKPSTRRTSKSKRSLSAIDPNELVELSSCFEGKLIYVSNSGYTIKWSEFGDVHLVPISELIKMRNEQPGFFRNHWVYPVSDNAKEVIEALQLERYYEGFEGVGSIDDLFECTPDKINSILRNVSDNVKENVARRAAQLIMDGVIDSVAVIEAVEKATGFKIREQA